MIASLSKKVGHVSAASAWHYLTHWGALRARLGLREAANEIEAARFIFPAVPEPTMEELRMGLLRNQDLFSAIGTAMVQTRRRRPAWPPWIEFLYLVVRISRPERMVETGVFDGQSSAVILQALADNDKGELVSVDLPAVQMIPGSTNRMQESALPPGLQPGWIIPEPLRRRHRLVLGDSRTLLPKVLEECGTIDIFFHDSLHTFEHQMFEYEAAWPHLKSGGVLLSDDVSWSTAYYQFCRRRQLRPICVGALGAALKPS